MTIEQVRSFALGLPRTTEAFVYGRVKFRVGQIVYAALSRDETVMGFGFPKEWRDALVQTEPDKFLLPRESDMRFNWVCVRLAAIDEAEMRELVLDAWAMVVPKKVSAPVRGARVIRRLQHRSRPRPPRAADPDSPAGSARPVVGVRPIATNPCK